MTRILLTGGSGFIAAWVLKLLLERGHSVVTTVRSEEKAQQIKKAYPSYGPDKLDFAIVPDISQEGAFDQAVISNPPFETVIHTASPFHHNIEDVEKDMLNPAIGGTTGILKAIKAKAPTVKRVVITSSFAAITNPKGPKGHVYSEKDWNPVTRQDAIENPKGAGYRASKTLAEKAAWDFVENEKPNFDLATCNPPLVLGPIIHALQTLSALNTSNQRVRDLISGACLTSGLPSNGGIYFWVDVRDVALVHVLAAESPSAGGQRFFTTAGYFCNKDIADIVAENFPELREKLPKGERLMSGDYELGVKERPGFDNARVKRLLGVEFMGLKESVIDTVKSLREVDG